MLFDRLVQSAPARVINVSAAAHRFQCVLLDNLNMERVHSGWLAYGASKTALILHAVELSQRASTRGVHAFTVDPGTVSTGLHRHLGYFVGTMFRIGGFVAAGADTALGCIGAKALPRHRKAERLNRARARALSHSWLGYTKSVEVAAATSIYCALAPALASGHFYEECRLSSASKYAMDLSTASALWRLSEQLCGVTGDAAAPAAGPSDDAIGDSRRADGDAVDEADAGEPFVLYDAARATGHVQQV